MKREELTEQVGIFLFKSTFSNKELFDKKVACQMGEDALQAIEASGFVIVDREPTETMIRKISYYEGSPVPKAELRERAAKTIWKLMIEASLRGQSND